MTEPRMTGIPQDPIAPPDRTAVTGGVARRSRRRRRRQDIMVPDAHFESYYGKPILKKPTWSARDIAGYLFLGGLAGGSSILAAGADVTGRRRLARVCKVGGFAAILGSLVALVHDLGRPGRFVNMLRVFKPSSPMSVGSWILALYGPQAGVAAVTELSGVFPRIGRVAGFGAALLGPAVATYTAALVSDTAVPAWHDGHREMPFVFAGSACTAAAGWAVLFAPADEAAPARRALIAGAATELIGTELMTRRMGLSGEPLGQGLAGRYMRTAKLAAVAAAAVGGGLGGRYRTAAIAGGAAAVIASGCTRFGIFHAGVASAQDPKYTVIPQRGRLDDRQAAE